MLQRAKRALGGKTTRATVEEALRLAADAAEDEHAGRVARERDYLERLAGRIDPTVLMTEEMWR